MKISISLPQEDIAFLDEHRARTSAPSGSAVVRRAVELFRAEQLEADYAAAFGEQLSEPEGA